MCNVCMRGYLGKECPYTNGNHNADDARENLTLASFQPAAALANMMDLAHHIHLDYATVYEERRAFVEALAALRLQDPDDQAAHH